MAKKFAVILSGCGYQDGSEIHEASMTLLAIKQSGHDYQCFAPNTAQRQVTNHITGEKTNETRNVLEESARIARGDIKPLNEFNPDDFDALMLPGGYGAALNLCSFAVDGADCDVNTDVIKAIEGMHQQKKPIGALCISPVILGKILDKVKVTVGNDTNVNEALHQMGAETQNTTHEEVVVDEENLVVTGPCYMLDANIVEIANGAQNVVNKILNMIDQEAKV